MPANNQKQNPAASFIKYIISIYGHGNATEVIKLRNRMPKRVIAVIAGKEVMNTYYMWIMLIMKIEMQKCANSMDSTDFLTIIISGYHF